MQLSIIIGIIISVLSISSGESPDFLSKFISISEKPDTGTTLLHIGIILAGFTLYLYINTRNCLLRWQNGEQVRPERIIRRCRVLTVITTAIIVFTTDWVKLISTGHIILLNDILAVVPFVTLLAIELRLCYKLDLILRGDSIASSQPEESSSHKPVWSVSEYLIYHLRHNLLIILVPMLLISMFESVGKVIVIKLSPYLGWSAEFIIGNELISLLGVLLIFVFSGPMLSCIWKTSPLAAGSLREEMEAFCRSVKLPYRDILIWHTHGMTANAAITGIFGPLRYIIVSDRLLASMNTAQLSAVFGHEAGHIRLKHIPLLFAAVFSMTICGGSLINKAISFIPETSPAWAAELSELTLIAVVTTCGFMLFSFISKNFEREADVFAAKALGNLVNLQPDTENRADTGKLSATGSAIMSSALNRLALTNGISPNKSTWRHGSLSDRMALLYELAVMPGTLTRFQTRITLIRISILALFSTSIYLILA